MQAHADTCKAPETSQHMPIHAQLATYEDNNTALNTRKEMQLQSLLYRLFNVAQASFLTYADT